MRFERAGISVEVPPGWAAALARRDDGDELPPLAQSSRGDQPPDPALAAERPVATNHPVLHLGSFPLPTDRGDYGSGAVDEMSATDVFVSLVEFHPDAAATPLFAREGIPRGLTAADFGADALQRVTRGQSGCQRFFRVNGRAFCLYVVLGSHLRRHMLVGTVNALLEQLEIAES